MCGIAGFVTNNLRLEKVQAKNIISNMCQAIRYRGPDDHGTYLDGFDKKDKPFQAVLGHNRLSIIDLSPGGHQPMSNEDKSIWITYNGEIYNYKELRDYLKTKRHIFRSNSDTEVIIHAYEEWKESCLEKFNGMFAFAIWDQRKNSLFLTRDRMGQKPLYYSVNSKSIIFASEPKSILLFPGFKKELDKASLKKYCAYEYVPSPHTIYKNIKRLQAGTFLIWKNKEIFLKKYWDISFSSTNNPNDLSSIRNLLKDSISKRLISDVPLGVFLSGGVDSSTITGLMTEIISPKNIKTFTMGFKDKHFDESEEASSIAKTFQTCHHQSILEPTAMIKSLPEIMNFLDEPLADNSIIPTYLLSKYTREHVKVVLGGDGGDELFAGYDTFPAHKIARMYKKIPSFLRKFVIEKLIQRLPVSLNGLSFDFKLKSFIKGMPYSDEIRNQIWLGSFSPQDENDLFCNDFLSTTEENDIFEDIHKTLKDCDAKNYLELIIYLHCKFYLQDFVLTKVDRASMACSLEVRAPFLDYRFVELVCSIPANLKLHGFKKKYLLKKLAKSIIPTKTFDKPKKGFVIPLAKWLKKDAKELLLDELSYEKIKREGIFNPQYIQELLKSHFKGLKDNRKQLWTLLVFELWYKKWFLGNN